MTTIVRIHHPVHAKTLAEHEHHGHHPHTHEIVLSDTAKDHIRHKFNPSGLHEVNNLKALTGALITYIETIKHNDKHGAGHEFDEALKFVKSASMWAVLGATKGK